MSRAAVRTVQTCYPQIYLACHTRHTRAASSSHHVSARDSALMSHLDERTPVGPASLARHLGVSGSTLSAAVARLVALGYVARTADARDARRFELRLTRHGAAAMRSTSVLDATRVAQLLERLTTAERTRALDGLTLLAAAARRMTLDDQPEGWRP